MIFPTPRWRLARIAAALDLPPPRQWPWLLAAILALAAAVRLWAALQHEALGQSDAYAHLQFLSDALTTGKLRHGLYPPLYHHLLAIPIQWFEWEPYEVVRWAGAVFGTALVGTIFALARRAFGTHAALWSAFLVAACPAFHHLQKTGVGAFPTQLGLLLLPALLWAWTRAFEGSWRAAMGFGLILAAMVGGAPMTLADMMPVFAADILHRARHRAPPAARAMVYGGLIAAGAGLVALLWRAGRPTVLLSILRAISETTGDSAQSASAKWARIVLAYVRPKRMYVGPPAVMFAAVGVLVVLAGAFVWAQRNNRPAARLLAIWGLTAWVQTVFGVWQFSLYWRAGWALLLALALWAGVGFAVLMRVGPALIGRAVAALTLASAVASFVFPPTPPPHLSAAEDDVVRFARNLRNWHERGRCGDNVEWARELAGATRVAIWSRPYFGTPNFQGEPLHAFLERLDRIELRTLRPEEAERIEWPADRAVAILLDDRAVPPPPTWATRLSNPALAHDFERNRERMLDAARALRKRTDEAERAGRRLRRYLCPHGLEILWIHPDRDIGHEP